MNKANKCNYYNTKKALRRYDHIIEKQDVKFKNQKDLTFLKTLIV